MKIESLIDQPPNYEEFSKLQTPLIKPPVDITFLDDVYTVGPSSSKRWRSFIDCTAWDPRNFHTRILQRRAYHARTAWEATYLLSFTDSSWISSCNFKVIQETAIYNLRAVEFELASFQLTSGMIGILFNGSNQDDLYNACVGMHTAIMWIVNKIYTIRPKSKEQRKEYSGLVNQKPAKFMSGRKLCILADEHIHELQLLLKNQEIHSIFSGTEKYEIIKALGSRLTFIIRDLDKVLVVK